MRKAAVNRNNIIYNKSQMLRAYADDIDIIGRELRYITAAFTSFEKQSAEVGLVINEDKTKLFVSTNKESTRLGPCVNVDNFEVVDDFVFIGSAWKARGEY